MTTAMSYSNQPLHILLVEDNPGDVLLLRQMLAGASPRVDVSNAERLASALQLLDQQNYDLVLLDLSLPDSQGYQTFEQLRAVAAHLPVILLTGLEDEELALRTVRSGAQDYLVKGEMDSHLLLRSIRYAIERKRTETMLRENQLRYKALFENENTGIFLISLEGKYLNVNQQAARMLGCQSEEIIGDWVDDFYVDGRRDDFQQRGAILLAEQTIPIYECLLQRAAQPPLPLEVNLTLVHDTNDQPYYIQMIARDISKRRQAEDALRAEREQLTQRVSARTAELRIANSELMRSARLKDEFLATVSHELRTPLSVILTLAEAIQDDIYGGLNEQQRKAMQRIRKSGRHLLALINDILDVSKIESGKFELEIGPVSVQTLCEDSVQMVYDSARQKQLNLDIVLDPDATILFADGRRLLQVLVNLLNNAVKFTPADGAITLTVTSDSAQEQIAFAVCDTGIGIRQEDMPKLFQPFVQLDSRLSRNYQGAGLGLALVYRLMKLHGGSVAVESTPGEGSCFSVVLPWQVRQQKPAVAAASALHEPEELPPRQRLRADKDAPLLLLAEDHLVALEAMDNYLRASGYRVIVARTGVEAVMQTRQQQPDLILMDVQMPEMDGLEAIHNIREQEEIAHIPIIALTALAMPGDQERCLAAGANAYVSKPISLRNLQVLIDQQLANSP